ncbi:unnamed protein product [Phytophthora fragariaefolia]|uniref:Unnamed protein product n=1 Tax=Phytophthora fragariaefolia TaxID=1490495 RepID=A0A9W6UAX8_9STRA|nr:unnamed protein product [Phytophthora fragariaefolia]
MFVPGEYVFPFSYQLERTLPGSFQLSNRHAGSVRNIRAQVKYEFTASQPVQGAFRADLETKRELLVFPVPAARIIRPMKRSTSTKVSMMTIFRKVSCQLSVSMVRDVYTPGEKMTVRCSLFNSSKMNVQALSLRLYEDLVLHHKKDGITKTSTCLCEGKFSGVIAGDSADRTVSLYLIEWLSGIAIRPSTTSRFVSWSYRVEVRCTFLMSPSVTLEFPVTIAHQNSMLQAASVPDAASEYPIHESMRKRLLK